MAPFAGPSRDELLAMLRSGDLSRFPITLGFGAPSYALRHENGSFSVVAHVIDREAASKAGREALARGDSWMPEHEWAFIVDELFFAAADLASLIEFVENWAWLERGWGAPSEPEPPPPELQPQKPGPQLPRPELPASVPPIDEIARPEGVPGNAHWSEDDNEWIVGTLDASGELHGEVSYWRADGTLCCVAQLNHGEYHGVARRYHETGELSGIQPYARGKMHGTRHWFTTTGSSTEHVRGPQDSELIYRSEAVYERGLTRRMRHFNEAGDEIDDLGEPLPSRPSNLPQTSFWRGRFEQWWDLALDENGAVHGVVTGYDRDGVEVWSEDKGIPDP